jgi:hypothetical protein
MRRSSPDLVRGALAALLLPLSAAAQPATPSGGGLALLAYVERRVEQSLGTASPRAATETGVLRFGDTLKSAPDAMARVEFPWMSLTLSPSTAVSFPDELVLRARLEQGRVVVQSGRREILKLVTPEASLRGRGRAIVRRAGDTTLVSCVEGQFVVTASGRALQVSPGQGALVRAGLAPQGPFDLPVPPRGLVPGSDPVYVGAGEEVALRWEPRGAAYSVEVLPVGGDTVLAQRDAASAALRLPLSWPGAFRWRVAARDAQGLEGLPSADGQIVVE